MEPERNHICRSLSAGENFNSLLERIFEKFQQVDNTSTRKKGGTGLGLAISRQFIQMHGGTIKVSSVVGQGTVFTVILPISVDDRNDQPTKR